VKNVQIIHVFNGIFFKDGIQYKYKSSYNTRIVCEQVDDPSKEIQFSSYDTVEVTDEEAAKIKAFLIDVYIMERSSLAAKKKDIIQLEQNGIKCYLDHFLPAIVTAWETQPICFPLEKEKI
jgi:hypothetical protein